jgi:hypothetical protein
MGSIGWINRFKSIHDIVCRTVDGESRSLDARIVEDWKNQFLQEIKKVTSVTYVTLMRQVYFSIYNLAKAFFFMESPAMVEQNQNSNLQCSLHAILLLIESYHHL